MQSLHLENIALLLSLQPVHIKVPRIPYPPHWKSGQRLSKSPQSLGDQIRKHRLGLRWLQPHLAKAMGVHVVSVSNWERGTSTPSRRMMKRIQAFLDYAPNPVPGSSTTYLCAWKCEKSETTGQLCLFEKICKEINDRDLQPQVTNQHSITTAPHHLRSMNPSVRMHFRNQSIPASASIHPI